MYASGVEWCYLPCGTDGCWGDWAVAGATAATTWSRVQTIYTSES